MEVRVVLFCENAVPGMLSVEDLFLLSLGQRFCIFLRKWRFGLVIGVFAWIRLLYLEGHIVYVYVGIFLWRR